MSRERAKTLKSPIPLIAAFVLLLSLLGSPAQASESPNNDSLKTMDLEIAPDGYWSDERIKNAAVDEPLISDRSMSIQQREAERHPAFSSTPYEEISYQSWLFPEPTPIVHDQIEHPRTVGKLITKSHRLDQHGQIPAGQQATDWSCTATVVTSASESVIITAAHCVWPDDRYQDSESAVFIPAYHKDTNDQIIAPFGQWDVTSAIAGDCWIENHEGQCDQAFLKVAKNSDGQSLQDVVGGNGLSIGGSGSRGAVDAYLPELTMHGYPIGEMPDPNDNPDPRRVYQCTGTSSPAGQGFFPGAIAIPCSEPISGGASGAAFIEHGQAGPMVIATFKGRESLSSPSLIAKLNDADTKDMYHQIDAY